ncbi:MAG: 50S ribosomal protein L32 [Deltaproteobacteria bacterium]|nr:50S ribosomal protein L32 [Deltaproteobacteria bacterium]
MPVPKKKRSRRKGRSRRAHQKLDVAQYIECPNCKKAMASHCVCEFCGHYKGKEIIRSEML